MPSSADAPAAAASISTVRAERGSSVSAPVGVTEVDLDSSLIDSIYLSLIACGTGRSSTMQSRAICLVSVVAESEARDELCRGERRAFVVGLHEVAAEFLEPGRCSIIADTDGDDGKPQVVRKFDE